MWEILARGIWNPGIGFWNLADKESGRCSSRKYPVPHNGGNWKLQRGGGGLTFPCGNGKSEGVGGGLFAIPSVVVVWMFFWNYTIQNPRLSWITLHHETKPAP